MATLCANLQDVATQLSAQASSRAVEQEATELLELLPQVLTTDAHPARVAALLFQVEPMPLGMVMRFTHHQLALSSKLRAFAIRTLSQVIGVALSPTCSESLAHRVADVCESLHIVSMLVAAIGDGHDTTDAMAASECLFVLAMQMPGVRDTAIEASVVRVCVERLRCTEHAQLKAFICALLRVLCESHCDAFVDRSLSFCDIAMELIEVRDASNQVPVLLLEMMTEMATSFPAAVIDLAASDRNAEIYVAVVAPLIDSDAPELATAAMGFVGAMLRVEGATSFDSPAVAHGFRAALNEEQSWQRAMAVAVSDARAPELLRLQRHLIATAVTSGATRALEGPFMAAFPTLCVLLNPERSDEKVMYEAALIISLMCAKSPRVRGDVCAMVRGYEAWATNLAGTIAACLDRAGSGYLRGMHIVDVHQCVLNDGEVLSRVDTLDEAAVARALFSEQERRSYVHSPPAPLRDVYGGPPARDRADKAAALALAVLQRAATLGLMPHAAHGRDEDDAVDRGGIAAQLSHYSNRSLSEVATPQRSRHSGAADLPRARTPHRMTPQKTPFRPSSPSSSARAGALGSTSRRAATPNSACKSVIDRMSGTPRRSDEYISMAIMMHLPVTYGVHYNRQAKGAVRRIVGPQGQYVQPIHRNVSHSWTALDVREGDVYVLFVPFHKLSVERISSEVEAVERYLLATKKQLVTTPQQQRTRRWFLHDMLNYVLPKTELLLRDFMSMLQQFGVDNVVYQLGVFRLLDESRKEREDALAVALEDSDSAMPGELLRFSTGRLKDVLHSGNLAYATKRLREHFFSDEAAVHDADRHDDFAVPASGPASHLATIDREIEKLERQAHTDGRDADELHGTVETAFDAFSGDSAPGMAAELPAHLRAQFERGDGIDEASEADRQVIEGPSVTDFDAMYAAVEESYREQ